jgi:hypothetical protein
MVSMLKNIYQIFNVIDLFEEEFDNKKYLKIRKYLNQKAVKDYLFIHLSKMVNPINWLTPLLEYFNPKEILSTDMVVDPKAQYYSRWSAIWFLVAVIKKNLNNPEPHTTKMLVKIIDEIIKYEQVELIFNKNYLPSTLMIELVFNLPSESLNSKHIKYIKYLLELNSMAYSHDINSIVIPRLIKGNRIDLLEKLLDIIIAYKTRKIDFPQGPFREFDSIMDSFYMEEMVDTYSVKLAELLNIKAIEQIKSVITSAKETDEFAFSTIHIKSFEKNPSEIHSFGYETIVIRLMNILLLNIEKSQIQPYISEFLDSDINIFNRIAFFIIKSRYEELNSNFWEWSSTHNPIEVFQDNIELRILINENCSSFTPDQLTKVISWIDKADFDLYRQGIKKPESTKRDAILKCTWFSTLETLEDTIVSGLFDKYDSICNFSSIPIWDNNNIEIFENSDKVNKYKEIIKAGNVVNIIEYFKSIPNIEHETDDTIRNISNLFENYVQNHVEIFKSKLDLFIGIHPAFQHSVLSGLLESFRSENIIPWQELFTFVENIIEKGSLWIEENGHFPFYPRWNISIIGDLINEGTRNDETAFDPKLLSQAESILVILSTRTSIEHPTDINDAITHTLNSVHGRLYTAMVNLSLRDVRVKNAKDHEWTQSLSDYFNDKIIVNPSSHPYIWIILGQYLKNFIYLDEEWTIKVINRFSNSSKEQSKYFEWFMSGYLFYSHTIYKDIYDRIKNSGNYLNAIKSNINNESEFLVPLINHISIGYYENWEQITDSTSLISELVANENPDQINELINFFWNSRNLEKEKLNKIIIPLWGLIFQTFRSINNKSIFANPIKNSINWLSLIEVIDDDIFKYAKFSAIHQGDQLQTSFAIKYLAFQSEKTPVKCGIILLEILNTDVFPSYKEENIIQIIENIYKADKFELGNQLCIKYAMQGMLFLREVYNNFNKIN